MKNTNTKAEAAPAQVGGHTPTGRDGSPLQWLVVNPEGKLLAVLDSESEAYWFTKNRGHVLKMSVVYVAAFGENYTVTLVLASSADRSLHA